MPTIAKHNPTAQPAYKRWGLATSVPRRGDLWEKKRSWSLQDQDSKAHEWGSALHSLAEPHQSSKPRFSRPSKSLPREFSLNSLHCVLSPGNFIFSTSKLIACLPVKVDSGTATGAEGHDFCRKNDAGQKDPEEDNGKAKLPGPQAHLQHGKKGGKTSNSSFVPRPSKCKSREITGALVKSSSSDAPSCCLPEPPRNTEGGRKKVICPGLWNWIFLWR